MTQEDAQLHIEDAINSMDKAIEHLELELMKIRAGKASPMMLEGLRFDYYGAETQVNQAANVSVQDAKTLLIQPWDKGALQGIEKAIMQANLGVTPQNDGATIRLVLPPVTEERRKELAKRAKGEGETAKVSVRNIRRDANEAIKKLQKDGLAEDIAKDSETKIQDATNKFIAKIDKHCADKEVELMTV